MNLRKIVYEINNPEFIISEEALDEGLWVDKDGELYVDDRNATALVPTPKFFIKKFRSIRKYWKKDIKIFPAYELLPASPTKDKEYSTELAKSVRHTVKYPKSDKSKQIVSQLVDVSLNNFEKMVDVESVDLILPLASKSTLNNELTEKLLEICPWAERLDDAFKKKLWKDVTMDPDRSHESKKSLNRAKAELEKFQRLYPDKEFQVHQLSGMGFRRYYDFLQRNPKYKKEKYESLIKDKTVVLVDDTMEEKVTIKQAIKQIRDFDPKEIIVYIFLMTVYPNFS